MKKLMLFVGVLTLSFSVYAGGNLIEYKPGSYVNVNHIFQMKPGEGGKCLIFIRSGLSLNLLHVVSTKTCKELVKEIQGG